MRALEFFAGIGGFACAAGRQVEPIAIDIGQAARRVYQLNFAGRYLTREIESLTASQLAELDADMWWLSPPCQPYSRRGQQRDLHDPRARSLLHLIDLIEPLKPKFVALENVSGFAHSQACERLCSTLQRYGYQFESRILCPTQFGWPNRRERFYLIAAEQLPGAWPEVVYQPRTISQILAGLELDAELLSALSLPAETVEKFGSGLDRVSLVNDRAMSACFGSSYGKSLLHAGSYVQNAGQLRRFHPREVASLMGFPASFQLPDDISNRQAWKLLGNSLSIPVVRYVLGHLWSRLSAM